MIVQRLILDEQNIVAPKWYTEQCLLKVIESLKKIRSNLKINTWILQHDNAKAYLDNLSTTGLKLLEHFGYNPHLAPCIFTCKVEMKIKGRQFSTNKYLPRVRENELAIISREMWQDCFWRDLLFVMEVILKKYIYCKTFLIGWALTVLEHRSITQPQVQLKSITNLPKSTLNWSQLTQPLIAR